MAALEEGGARRRQAAPGGARSQPDAVAGLAGVDAHAVGPVVDGGQRRGPGVLVVVLRLMDEGHLVPGLRVHVGDAYKHDKELSQLLDVSSATRGAVYSQTARICVFIFPTCVLFIPTTESRPSSTGKSRARPRNVQQTSILVTMISRRHFHVFWTSLFWLRIQLFFLQKFRNAINIETHFKKVF